MHIHMFVKKSPSTLFVFSRILRVQQFSFSVAPAWHPSQLQPSPIVLSSTPRSKLNDSCTGSETAVGASTTSVTKLERLTRMSGMKRMHAGITFEELFGTSLKFGLCQLSNTCCFYPFRADQSHTSRFLQLRNARWR